MSGERGPQTDLDKAIEAYRAAHRQHREAKDRRARLSKEYERAEQEHLEASRILTEARDRLDTALDADRAEQDHV